MKSNLIVALVLCCIIGTLAQNVLLEFFVMSKCPDAYACETTYAPVISKVGSIVDFEIHYIGSVDPDTETGFDCMHGQSECKGDMLQLCAQTHYPKNYTWYNYILCQDESQDDIPDNSDACARRSGMNVDTLNSCFNGTEGKNLMTQSIQYTQDKGIEVCCTIYMQGQLFCVHDGDWQDCKTHSTNGIISAICNAYGGPNPPPACNNLN